VNLAQLQTYLQNNKPVVLGVGAAGVAGLALLQRKKKSSAAAYDVYSALTGQLGALSEQVRQTSGSSVTSAPAPLASSLFAPNMTGQYVGYRGDGSAGSNGIYEVETDGSLYHLDMPEWQKIIASSGGKEPATTTYTGRAPVEYAASTNLANKINKAAGVS
jgi:hypothetical protein